MQERIYAWQDTRLILDSAGNAVSVWTYTQRDGRHIDGDSPYSGIGPGSVGHFAEAMGRDGHAITMPVERPWAHHVIGCGVGHDDAEFAESGRSMAAYYESGEAYRGKWWESEYGRRQYGFIDETCCYGCGQRGALVPGRNIRYCDACIAETDES